MTKRSLYWVALTLLVILPFVFVGNLMIPEQNVVAQGKITTLSLADELDEAQKIAEKAALADARVQAYTTGYRTEVFGVQTVSHQFNEATSICATVDCRQVNIFNFDESATIAVMVNVETGIVLDVLYQPSVRPGINKRLADKAMEIALNAPEVIDVLGYKPTSSDWAPMDSSFADTLCEAGHMCVAPTFNLGQYILWAVVDLTDETLVDTYWTAIQMDESNGQVRYPDAYETLSEPECVAMSGAAGKNGWAIDWEVTAHDGFHIYDVTFNDVPVLTSAKLVEWHTDYGDTGYVDSTGCGGGGGGFGIAPYGDMIQSDLLDENNNIIGFSLLQDFRMAFWGQACQYRYDQRYEFYNDGRYRVVAGAYGKGCSNEGVYRPVIRIDVAVAGDENDSFELWGSDWTPRATEVRVGPNHPTSPEGYVARVVDQSGKGYFVEPGNGQFNDGGRGDNEFLYATEFHLGEGEGDWPVFAIGCCDADEHGPEIFLNNQPIANQNIVLWYVSEAEISTFGFEPSDFYCWTGTAIPELVFPCFTGPMFTPFEPTIQPQATFTYTSPIKIDQPTYFNNTSSGGGDISYAWDFGDGQTSTEMNPYYTYTVSGEYTVTLTVTNEIGSDTISQSVEVLEIPTVVVLDKFETKPSSVPTLLFLWAVGSILAIVISLKRITSLYKR